MIWFIRMRKGKNQEQLDPLIRALHQVLKRMDRKLEKQGLVRESSETLHQFASRIASQDFEISDSASSWYLKYADLRYRGTCSFTDIEQLKEEGFIRSS